MSMPPPFDLAVGDDLLARWEALPLDQWPPVTDLRGADDYWVIYARISADPNHTLEGVRRQVLLCLRTLVRERHLWAGKVVLRIDNDLSAAKAGVVRPAYQQILKEDVPSGRCRGVAVYALDRFYRRLIDLEDIIDIFGAANVPVSSYSGSNVDLSTREGRTFARLIAVLARSEIEAIQERLRAWHAQAALDGRVNGKPGYGYTRTADGGMVVVEEEAKILRWIAEELLKGEKLDTVARKLNDMGLPTRDAGLLRRGKRTGEKYTVSGKWTGTNLKTSILRPRLVGWRTHKGVVVNRQAWDPIFDEVTHQRLKATLGSHKRTTLYGRGPGRVHLLTGLIVCGRCRVEGKTAYLTCRNKWGPKDPEGGKGTILGRVYICVTANGGCNRVSRDADKVEAVVESWARAALAANQVKPQSITDEAETVILRASIEGDEEMLLEISEDRTEKRITRAQFLKMTDEVNERIAEAKKRLVLLEDPAEALAAADVAATLAHWDTLPVQRKHDLIASVAKEVVLLPASRRGVSFDPETVQVVPHLQPESE